jgi:hypothetical protein
VDTAEINSPREITMNPNLNGKWAYSSFHSDPIAVKDGKVDGNPDLAIPWAPLGEMNAETDAKGIVKGRLTFAPGVAFAVIGHIIPPPDHSRRPLKSPQKGFLPSTGSKGSSSRRVITW